MADDTDGAEERNAEMRAINENLVIAAVRQQELAETAMESTEIALKSSELYRLLAGNFPNGMGLLFDHDLRHKMKHVDAAMYRSKQNRHAETGLTDAGRKAA